MNRQYSRRSAFVTVMAIAGGLLGGCAVGPDYVRPDIATPEGFRFQQQVERRDAPAGASIDRWWDGFQDPQLTRIVELARERNLDVAQADARILQARAVLGMANASLLPAGGVSGQAVRAYQSVETPMGQLLKATPGFDRYGSVFEANMGASWELDLFGTLRRGREAGIAELQASQADAVAMRLAVTAQAADTYVTIRGLQARLGIARKQVETQEGLVSLISLLLGKGLVPERDLWQAEGALAQVRATLPEIEMRLDSALNALDVLLGYLPGTHRAELAEPRNIPVAPRIDHAGSPSELLRRRPDLIVAERHLAASNARIGMAVGEYFPKLSLAGFLGSASTSSDQLFTSSAMQAASLVGLRWRLFDFHRIDAEIGAAKSKDAEMLAAYRLAVLRATEDVENSFSALLRNQARVDELGRAVDSLGRARTAADESFRGGVVSLIDVLHADENLLAASDQRAIAQTEVARAAIASFRALGGGWRSDESADMVAAPAVLQ